MPQGKLKTALGILAGLLYASSAFAFWSSFGATDLYIQCHEANGLNGSVISPNSSIYLGAPAGVATCTFAPPSGEFSGATYFEIYKGSIGNSSHSDVIYGKNIGTPPQFDFTLTNAGAGFATLSTGDKGAFVVGDVASNCIVDWENYMENGTQPQTSCLAKGGVLAFNWGTTTTQSINLSTSTPQFLQPECDSNSGLISYGFCWAGTKLFYPDEAIVSQLEATKEQLFDSFPLSMYSDALLIRDELTGEATSSNATTTFSISVPYGFGSSVINSTTTDFFPFETVAKFPLVQYIRSVLGDLIYIATGYALISFTLKLFR